MLTVGVTNDFYTSSTFDSRKLHEGPGIQSQAAAAVVTMDTDTDTLLRDRLVKWKMVSTPELYTLME